MHGSKTGCKLTSFLNSYASKMNNMCRNTDSINSDLNIITFVLLHACVRVCVHVPVRACELSTSYVFCFQDDIEHTLPLIEKLEEISYQLWTENVSIHSL